MELVACRMGVKYSQLCCVMLLAWGVCAQEIHPIWVQHHNGAINVDTADKLPILIRRGASGGEAYADFNHGRSRIEGFANFLRYDADHYLLGMRENGIDEQTETNAANRALAAQYPDRSIIWIDARTGRPLGVAAQFPYQPLTNAAQGGGGDFWWKWGIDDGTHGQRVLYTTYRYKILRWAPAGLIDDPDFPNRRPTWSVAPTVAWTEPVPGEPNPSVPPWDKWANSIHSSPAPRTPDDTNHLANYIGSSGGEGSDNWRFKAFRVSGSGSNTVLWAGGGTWRASMQAQELVSSDGGLTFYPRARLSDRADGYGLKGTLSMGGQPSHVRTTADGRKWVIQTHYPGANWLVRPGRYSVNPQAADDELAADSGGEHFDANDAGLRHKERRHFYDPDHRAVGGLEAFEWDAAGAPGRCVPNLRVDGVNYYDGNWVLTADTVDGLDYFVTYAIPSWDQQLGGVGAAWPTSIDPNATFRPGWVGLHTLDGRVAPGAGNSWMLPCYETDEPIVAPNSNAGTGFDYGYDGDVNVYADSDSPAGAQCSKVLVSFGQYGFGVFQVQNVLPFGTLTGPTDIAVSENQPLVLRGEFVGAGSPLFYRWQKAQGDSGFIDLPTGRGNLAGLNRLDRKIEFVIPHATPSDAGRYRFLVGNSLNWLVSSVAEVAVPSDRLPPVAVAAGSVDGNSVDIQFDGQLNPATATNGANYRVTDPNDVVITGATLRDDGKAVFLRLGRTVTRPFTIALTNISDLSGNVTLGQRMSVQPNSYHLENLGDGVGTSHAPAPGVLQIEAIGNDFATQVDSGYFVYQTVTGDFDVRVQLVDYRLPSNRNGIMVRQSLVSDGPMVHVTWNPATHYASLSRPYFDGLADWFNPERNWICGDAQPPNVWLRLKRSGDLFSSFHGTDGLHWIPAGTTSVELPPSVLLGLAANSGDYGLAGSVTFANFGPTATLRIERDGAGKLVVSLVGQGVIETSPALDGPWTRLETNESTFKASSALDETRFFRLR